MTSDHSTVPVSQETLGRWVANDLDDGADGIDLLAVLGQTVSFDTDQDTGYIHAYQGGNAYLYHVAKSNDARNVVLVAGDIAVVGVFNCVAVGAFDATDFIDS